MASTKITKRVVDEAKHPGDADGTRDPRSMLLIYDADIKGFALKVTPAGKKVFVVDWRQPGGALAPKGRTTIGNYGAMTVDMARDAARDILDKVRKGINPNHERQDKARSAVDLAFDKVATRFIDDYAKENQKKSWQQSQRTFDRDITPVFGSRPINTIGKADIDQLLQDIKRRPAPFVAKYAHAQLRKMFRWAANTGRIERSPMEGMESPVRPKIRDRYLNDPELLEVWQATREMGEPFGTIYRLLIATGQRLNEVGGMAKDEIDMAKRLWTIPAHRAKNGKSHVVHLNDLAVAELGALRELVWVGRDELATDLLFASNGKSAPSGWSKVKLRCDTAILAARQLEASKQGKPISKVKGLVDDKAWRTHDLRRSVATGMQELGIRLEVIERTLNHISGISGGALVKTYHQSEMLNERRVAMDAWGNHLAMLIDGDVIDQTNVVPMERLAANA
jgi:integrase